MSFELEELVYKKKITLLVVCPTHKDARILLSHCSHSRCLAKVQNSMTSIYAGGGKIIFTSVDALQYQKGVRYDAVAVSSYYTAGYTDAQLMFIEKAMNEIDKSKIDDIKRKKKYNVRV